MDMLQLPNTNREEHHPVPVTPHIKDVPEQLISQITDRSNFTNKSEKLSKCDKIEYVETEEVHNVSIKVTICAAFPIDEGKEIQNLDPSNKPRATEGPKPLNFYKFEYHLMPDDPEPVQADLVTYKAAAKLFPEKSDPKIIKSWENEDKIWVVWTQTHELKLTKSRLLMMFDHEIILKIWDSRDFCSARTKFDKPKPFKFSKTASATSSLKLSRNISSAGSEIENRDQLEENVKRQVLENCDLFLKQIPEELQPRLGRKLPNQARIDTPQPVNITESTEKFTNTLVAVPIKSATTTQKNTNKLTELALDTDMVKSVKNLRNTDQKKSLAKNKAFSKGSESQFDLETNRSQTKRQQSKIKEKSKKELAAELEYIKKNGVAQVKLKMKVLFSGESYLGARINDPISTLEDCIISINLENSLMSENQLYELNPLTIKIEKLTNMPQKPVSLSDLKEKCFPVYCSYSFFQQPLYRTEGILHDKNIFYHDVNVFLLGLLNKEELHEFLHSAPFEIEVHDRDRRAKRTETLKACIFGNDPNDDNISNVHTSAAKTTATLNPYDKRITDWDPYGIAKLNLYDLVMDKKLVEFCVPVLPCPIPDILGRNPKNFQAVKKLDDGSQPMQAGAFLDSNTHLSVQVKTAKPVFLGRKSQKSADKSNHCVFGRLLIKLDSSRKNVALSIRSKVKQINAEALGFNKYPSQVQEAAISTYKLNNEQQEDKDLNILTGFHILSDKYYLFVLEGLKSEGIKTLFEHFHKFKGDNSVEIIYNSKMTFSKRIYGSLDVDILTIKLFEPLEDIVKKPLLYIRDMTPKSSFEALVKIHQLFFEYHLRSMVRNDLFPTSEMVLSMSKEFGVPSNNLEEEFFKSNSSITAKQTIDNISEMNVNANNEEDFDYEKIDKPNTSRVWTPLDNDNDKYLTEKNDRYSSMPNFILNNIENIQEASEFNKSHRPRKNYIITDKFSYSCQSKNSTEMVLNEFREQINPKESFSFNPNSEYSTLFVPVNIKKEEAKLMQASIDKWKSAEGWIFPDVKTTLQSNEHPKKPLQSAIDELCLPWDENALNTYKLKSPLERTFFKGSMRKNDFDLWKRLNVSDSEPPITIFEAGAVKEALNKENDLNEFKIWKNKLVVEDTALYFHKLAASTESKERGPKASNQLDKLRGILKSEPAKKSLLLGGTSFDKIPALSVLKSSYSDHENFCNPSKGFTNGDDFKLRITNDLNKIPVFNYNHAKFKRIKGKDFDLSLPQPSNIYRRKLKEIKVKDDLKSSTEVFTGKVHSPYIISNSDM